MTTGMSLLEAEQNHPNGTPSQLEATLQSAKPVLRVPARVVRSLRRVYLDPDQLEIPTGLLAERSMRPPYATGARRTPAPTFALNANRPLPVAGAQRIPTLIFAGNGNRKHSIAPRQCLPLRGSLLQIVGTTSPVPNDNRRCTSLESTLAPTLAAPTAVVARTPAHNGHKALAPRADPRIPAPKATALPGSDLALASLPPPMVVARYPTHLAAPLAGVATLALPSPQERVMPLAMAVVLDTQVATEISEATT